MEKGQYAVFVDDQLESIFPDRAGAEQYVRFLEEDEGIDPDIIRIQEAE